MIDPRVFNRLPQSQTALVLRATVCKCYSVKTAFLILVLLFTLYAAVACGRGERRIPRPAERPSAQGQNAGAPQGVQQAAGVADAPVSVSVNAELVQRTLSRQLLGQDVWYSWQAYAWDSEARQIPPDALALFTTLGMGLVGHYPGVGVITHDFNWKNLIGPLEQRTDPTPRQNGMDTPKHLAFGPDEYGQSLEQYRQTVNWDVAGSIQVNIVNGTAEDAADWVEYMNAPNDGSNPGGGTDWAAERASHGHPEPYGIHYWELGNEPHFTASNIGGLTAEEYVQRIREFVPLMKERDPSIEVMAYVNPFAIGDPDLIGVATADLATDSGITWTQTVIRDAGEYLDYLYFHWYGGWNDRRHDYEFVVTSMHSGLVPLLDRVLQDVENFAPNDAARERLRRIIIPEWNVYGGWFKPLAKGTALQGALAYSRTLHVFAARGEVQAAQHLGLLAPFPDPPFRPVLADIREGYFIFRANEEGTEFMGTAAGAAAELWSKAFASEAVSVSMENAPVFDNGVPTLDISALRSPDGKQLNLVITNAGAEALSLHVELAGFTPAQDVVRLSIRGNDLSDNNEWSDRGRISIEEAHVSFAEPVIEVPPYSIEAFLLTNSQ